MSRVGRVRMNVGGLLLSFLEEMITLMMTVLLGINISGSCMPQELRKGFGRGGGFVYYVYMENKDKLSGGKYKYKCFNNRKYYFSVELYSKCILLGLSQQSI